MYMLFYNSLSINNLAHYMTLTVFIVIPYCHNYLQIIIPNIISQKLSWQLLTHETDSQKLSRPLSLHRKLTHKNSHKNYLSLYSSHESTVHLIRQTQQFLRTLFGYGRSVPPGAWMSMMLLANSRSTLCNVFNASSDIFFSNLGFSR